MLWMTSQVRPDGTMPPLSGLVTNTEQFTTLLLTTELTPFLLVLHLLGNLNLLAPPGQTLPKPCGLKEFSGLESCNC